MVDAANGLAAGLAALEAFVLADVIIEPGETVEGSAADGTGQLRFFVVVVVRHEGDGEGIIGQGREAVKLKRGTFRKGWTETVVLL